MRHRSTVLLVTLITVWVTGCAPSQPGAPSGSGGITAVGAGTGGGGDGGPRDDGVTASGGSSGASVDGASDHAGPDGGSVPGGPTCPEAPNSWRTTGVVVDLPLQVMLEAKALRFSEANTVTAPPGAVTPLNLRFYLSQAALLRANGDPLPVDIVNDAGRPVPYGVHFYNAEDPASTTLHLLAPPGSYLGVTFVFGLPQSCNVLDPGNSNPPLSATSQMSWPHTGYLFFKYEGQFSAVGGGPDLDGGADGKPVIAVDGAPSGGDALAPSPTAPPTKIHMGGSLFLSLAPTIQVRGVLSVPTSGRGPSQAMRVVLDEIFRGALKVVDISDAVLPPGEEAIFGERLRRNMPDLQVFAF